MNDKQRISRRNMAVTQSDLYSFRFYKTVSLMYLILKKRSRTFKKYQISFCNTSKRIVRAIRSIVKNEVCHFRATLVFRVPYFNTQYLQNFQVEFCNKWVFINRKGKVILQENTTTTFDKGNINKSV